MSKHTINRRPGAVLADFTGLPLDVIGSHPIFQMYSNREMIVEGAESLEYYDECSARIRTRQNCVCIEGRGLTIKCLANKNISVCGMITCIRMEHQ